MTPIIAYIRVSTGKQEASGLGLEAQLDYIKRAAHQQGWEVVATYTETVSGAKAPTERPECSKALTHAQSLGCPIIVAKLDRLSRDVEHVAGLMKVHTIRVATMPQADNFQLHLFAALAQQEREFISQRTKDALKALEQRAQGGCIESVAKLERRSEALRKGSMMGNTGKAREARTSKATTHAQSMKVHLLTAMYSGCTTLQSVADWFTQHNLKTTRDGLYSKVAVSRLMDKLDVSFKC